MPAGVYILRRLVLLRCFCVFDLLKVRDLLEVRQVQRGAKGGSVCRESHQMREIREGHDVLKS